LCKYGTVLTSGVGSWENRLLRLVGRRCCEWAVWAEHGDASSCGGGDWSGPAMLHTVISEKNEKKSLADKMCVYDETESLTHEITTW